MTGDDLRDFVNQKLFPYLHGFKQKATRAEHASNTRSAKSSARSKTRFSAATTCARSSTTSTSCASARRRRSTSCRTSTKPRSGTWATRAATAASITRRARSSAPSCRSSSRSIGERIYDGAVGSAGFLCESFDFIRARPELTVKDLNTLQTRTFYGKEKKSLAYVIAIMNMILHGIEAPNIVHTNTLTENLADIQEKDRFDVVLANPPFGGKERKEVQQNFPIRTGETAFLFLQHFIKMLKAGGRGGVVIKNTFLSNTDNASVSLRKMLLESCNLHTVLDCPGGTFQGAGVKTVVLFFEKGAPTRKVWYYQLDPGRNLGKTNPLNDDDLTEFVALQKTFADSPKSWSVDADEHRPEDLRPLREEPERRRGRSTPQTARHHG